MLNRQALRTVLGTLAAAILLALLALAAAQWFGGDKTTSLAVGVTAATLALAFAAAFALDQDRSLLKAASDQAAASWQTVEEMKRERELAYKPLLVVSQGAYDPQPNSATHMGFPVGAFIIRNIGTGPAINVAFCAQALMGEPPSLQWISAQFPGMAVGTEERVPKFYAQKPGASGISPDRFRCLVEDWQWGDDGLVFAVRYEDWFGTHYLSPGGPQSHVPAEWRGAVGTLDQPNWVRCN